MKFDATYLSHSSWTIIPEEFQGYPKSWAVVNSLASSTLQSENIPKVSNILGHFKAFFFTKFYFPAKRPTFAYSMSYIFRNLICFSAQFELSWNIFSAYCNASDLLTPAGWYVHFFLQCFLGGIWWLWNMKLREIHLTYTYWPPRILCSSDGFCPDDK